MNERCYELRIMLIQIYYLSIKKLMNNLILFTFLKVQNISKIIYLIFFKYILCIIFKTNYLYIILKKNEILNIILKLKNLFNLLYKQLLDLVIVDRLEIKYNKKKRFSFTYVLLSLTYNTRLFVTGFLSLFETLPSIYNLYKSADWLEREVWDMFGIFFTNHINLRRILSDYGFIGFPLRKDFPLSGYIELRYDEITKSIILEPLELSQEFRFFKLEIPWKK